MMHARPFHILLADDDEDDQFLMADTFRFFQPQQLQISSARNGIELMSRLLNSIRFGQQLPDAIVLDINMPLMNGMEALQKIKADPALRHLPVYIVTTLRNMEKLEECLEKGAASFFTKPNHTRDYVMMVEEILQGLLHNKLN
jgi:CheY-like chemotaxis protein